METKKDRRRKHFIDSNLQGRLIGLVIVLILIVAAGGIVPLLVIGGGEEGIEAQKISDNYTNLILILSVIVTLAVLLTIFYGVRLSHRIVGPIYAFSRHLIWIRDGIYARDLRLREKDEFKNLAKVFNAMQSSLRHRSQETINTCIKIEENLEELQKILGEQDFDVERADKMIEGLKQDLFGLRQDNEKYISQS